MPTQLARLCARPSRAIRAVNESDHETPDPGLSFRRVPGKGGLRFVRVRHPVGGIRNALRSHAVGPWIGRGRPRPRSSRELRPDYIDVRDIPSFGGISQTALRLRQLEPRRCLFFPIFSPLCVAFVQMRPSAHFSIFWTSRRNRNESSRSPSPGVYRRAVSQVDTNTSDLLITAGNPGAWA